MMLVTAFIIYYLVLISSILAKMEETEIVQIITGGAEGTIQVIALGPRSRFWKVLCDQDLENIRFHQLAREHLQEAQLFPTLSNVVSWYKKKNESWKKININTVVEEYGDKISIWESHVGNVLRGNTELMAENVKHSNEIEGLHYFRKVCFVLENMQPSLGRRNLPSNLNRNDGEHRFPWSLNRSAN